MIASTYLELQFLAWSPLWVMLGAGALTVLLYFVGLFALKIIYSQTSEEGLVPIQCPKAEQLGAFVYGVGCAALFGPTALVLAPFYAMFVLDWRYHFLPDALTIPFLFSGLFVSALAGADMPMVIASATAGYLLLWLPNFVYWFLMGQDGMGGGDMKLVAGLGAWLGYSGLAQSVLIACAVGLVVAALAAMGFMRKHQGQYISFGPSLLLGALPALLGYIVLPLNFG